MPFLYRAQGVEKEWMAAASPATKRMCAEVNGHLFQDIASLVGKADRVDVFRDGTSTGCSNTGQVPVHDSRFAGAPLYDEASQAELSKECARNNCELISSLRYIHLCMILKGAINCFA